MEKELLFDLFVIGGSSGALSCARSAASLGAKVGLADFVKPSLRSTKRTYGGSCINVKALHRKLFHYTSLLGQSIDDLKSSGWEVKNKEHNWSMASEKIAYHIRSLNYSNKEKLKKENLSYFNTVVKLTGENQIEFQSFQGSTEKIWSDNILIAPQSRPNYLQIPGAREHCITSDDIFWKKEKPGKTLIIGESHTALECAGFLDGLGVDVTLMAQSTLLKSFDQQIVNMVRQNLEKRGIKIITEVEPKAIVKNAQNKKVVTFVKNEKDSELIFDEIILATGRSMEIQGLNLEQVGVKVNKKNGKIIVHSDDKTDARDIYAIGDCVDGSLQLTTATILAGKLLAHRLFSGSKTKIAIYSIQIFHTGYRYFVFFAILANKTKNLYFQDVCEILQIKSKSLEMREKIIQELKQQQKKEKICRTLY